MTTNSVQIQNLTAEEFTATFRQIVKEEILALQTKELTPRFLSRQEVANLLKISLPTLNEYTRTGIIKGSRIGSRILYAEIDVKEAVKDIPTLKYRRG